MREYTVKNNDFSEFDSKSNLILEKVDRNGTHYYTDCRCPKCGGTGYISCYNHVDGGVCFLCDGSGRHGTRITVRTIEYQEKLNAQRLEKARKTAGKRNTEFLHSQGFSTDGKTWIVMGETYSRKEELKNAGCKWDPELGWHFDHEVNNFDTVLITIQDSIPAAFYEGGTAQIGQYDMDGTLHFLPCGFLRDHVKSLREQYVADHAPKTEYFGSVGDKVELNLEIVHIGGYETMYGFTTVYTFVDSESHQFVWKTSSSLGEINAGDSLKLKGTIKAHSEYRGLKQTELIRCKRI